MIDDSYLTGEKIKEMLDEGGGPVIGVCPFGCNKDEPDGQVEFDEQLNFSAQRFDGCTFLTSCELSYTCACCHVSFSIGESNMLDVEDVRALQASLKLINPTIPGDKIFGDEKLGLIGDFSEADKELEKELKGD